MKQSPGKILIVDFGSQSAHLIGRRVRQLGAQVVVVTPARAMREIKQEKPLGIILSGGPASVFAKGAPTIDRKIFSFGIPVMGICYGMQLMSELLGGKAVAGKKEYGPAVLSTINNKESISKRVVKKSTVWMSHGVEVVKIPKGFETLGSTTDVPFAFVQDKKRKLYGLQFHPEIEHTVEGLKILKNFLAICEVYLIKPKLDPKGMIAKIREIVGDAHVIGAVSGGVDSTVAGTLVAEAIGKQFTPIFVNNGLMRDDAAENVKQVFGKYSVKPVIVNVEPEMLRRLKGITDSEKKRKIIGAYYIEIFEKEMARLVRLDHDVKFLLQGTIYSDVIESKGTAHADKIKSHHNVGGLPKNMKLKLIEPLRELYKDEVRELGAMLGLPKKMVWQQVFPGPGHAVRIRGEVTRIRLKQAKAADKIIDQELAKAGLLDQIYMAFPVMSGAYSTAVKGDGRAFEEVVALRIIESKDVMSTTWSRLPYDVLQSISSRIVNEVPGVSRVVYDITTKPPATMEWE